MNLSLGAIFTVEAIFTYVILGQELAEELRAIRPTRRSTQQFHFRPLESFSGCDVESTTNSLWHSGKSDHDYLLPIA
jgi:hypothetical protein